MEETGSRRVQNDTLTNSVPSDSQLRGSVGQYSSEEKNYFALPRKEIFGISGRKLDKQK